MSKKLSLGALGLVLVLAGLTFSCEEEKDSPPPAPVLKPSLRLENPFEVAQEIASLETDAAYSRLNELIEQKLVSEQFVQIVNVQDLAVQTLLMRTFLENGTHIFGAASSIFTSPLGQYDPTLTKDSELDPQSTAWNLKSNSLILHLHGWEIDIWELNFESVKFRTAGNHIEIDFIASDKYNPSYISFSVKVSPRVYKIVK